MHRFVLFLFLFLALVCTGTKTFSQQKEGANWVVGGDIHVNFNGVKPLSTVLTFGNGPVYGDGSATISNAAGELLFFTRSGYVYGSSSNGTYLKMSNGNLFPNTSNRNFFESMIIQSPGDSNIYYLFFTDMSLNGSGNPPGLYTVQIDLRLNNGYGDVVPNTRRLLKKNVDSIKLTALLHSNNRDAWILTQTNDNDSTIAFLLTPNGIKPKVATKTGQRSDNVSKMKASLNSEMFVVGSGANTAVEVYEFNRTTGVPSLKYFLSTPDARYKNFSFAFSPDNAKLYVGTNAPGGIPEIATIYQFDLAAGSTAQIQQTRNVVFQIAGRVAIFDVQLAIDGKLYISAGDNNLSQISCPNLYGSASRAKLNAITFPAHYTFGTTLATNQIIFRYVDKLQAKTARKVICEGESVQLFAYGAGAEKFNWQPANGLVSPSDTLANPVVKPTSTTTYVVIGSNACRSDTAYVEVVVIPRLISPLQLSISGPLQVYSYSENQKYSVQNPVIGNKYSWFADGGKIIKGQNDSVVFVNWDAAGTGTITVTETNAAGCELRKASLQVQLAEGPEPLFYNIITPNNDGRNDTFIIENLKWYPENELKVFNRWGGQVFQCKDYRNNWKAEKLSAGVYYYYFKSNGKAWKGWVEIVR